MIRRIHLGIRKYLPFGLTVLMAVVALLSVNSSRLAGVTAPVKVSLPARIRSSDASFVTRSGTSLLLNGQPFRFSGANIYWLGLEEVNTGNFLPIAYPSHFQVDDALATAQTMGATVVRSHTLGISVGCSLCVEPTLGTFNQQALQQIDYAIQSAHTYGIKLIIPLVDNWHFYHGGKHTFTDWRGISDENQFYSNPQVIGDFEQYVSVILNHINTYTGIAYKNDPTIMTWELGNELSAPANWVNLMATYVKSIDPQHLVMDGNYEQADETANFLPDLSIAAVDMYTGHYYPPNTTSFLKEAKQAYAASKVFVAGEYDWNTFTPADIKSFLLTIENSTASGDLYWSLFPHDDYYGFVFHNEHYTLHYPGDTADMRIRVTMLRQHAFVMQNVAAHRANNLGSPVITFVYENQIAWRGVAGAIDYTVERSTTRANGPWTVICNQCATDNDTPWRDQQVPTGPLWYRVIAYNLSGVASSPSASFMAGSIHTMVDNLNDWSKVYQHSSDLTFVSANSRYMRGDTSRIMRTSATHQFVIWRQTNIQSFQAIVYYWPGEPISPLSFYTSSDGTNWTAAVSGVAYVYSGWLECINTLQGLTGVNYVKVVWNNTTGYAWNPNLGDVIILYGG